MKKLALIASWVMLILWMVGCVCGTCNDEKMQLHPTEVNKYRLYLDTEGSTYRDFTEYTYELPEKTIKMFRNPDGVVSIYIDDHNIPVEQKPGSILEQDTYFDY